MRNVTLKNSLFLLIGVSAIAWFLLAYLNNLDLSKVKDFFGLVPKVVSIDLMVITIFVKWGWKLKIFRGWLVPFPNLQGTWSGKIYSDWVNPDTQEKVSPIPVLLSINQSFFHISCKMMTGEMDSFSTAEGFNIEPDRQIKRLAYIYTSKPRISVSQRSISHDGSIVFDIVEKPDQKLKGRYWTERKTTGEIVLKKHSEDLLEDLTEEFTQHPVTEKENLR